MQVFACPLRNDSSEVLKELKGASHDLVCIYCATHDQSACMNDVSKNTSRILCHVLVTKSWIALVKPQVCPPQQLGSIRFSTVYSFDSIVEG